MAYVYRILRPKIISLPIYLFMKNYVYNILLACNYILFFKASNQNMGKKLSVPDKANRIAGFYPSRQ